MMEYSVLMSVYAGENAGYFRCAAESMLAQTAAPAEFVLVCDGPLTPALVMRVWWAVVDAAPQPLQDHDELRWLPRGRWLSVDWLPGDVPLVEVMERLAAPG